MAAGARTEAGTMAGWAGSGAGTMAAGAETGAGTMAAGAGTEAWIMAVWTGAGTMAAGAETGAGTMAAGAGTGAGTMAAGAGTGAGTMAAGAGTEAWIMAVWTGSGAGNMAVRSGSEAGTMAAGAGTGFGTMAAGHGTGTRNHGCVGWYWSTVPRLCGPALEHGTMAVWAGTGARAGLLALRLLEVLWRLRGPPNARRDPEKGSENGDWPSGLREKTLSTSGNELLHHGTLSTSICAFLRTASLSLLAKVSVLLMEQRVSGEMRSPAQAINTGQEWNTGLLLSAGQWALGIGPEGVTEDSEDSDSESFFDIIEVEKGEEYSFQRIRSFLKATKGMRAALMRRSKAFGQPVFCGPEKHRT
ncbi:hypothetical protein F7725_009638 [Dissostichus mawsoni]|uniref:Uncharacterized protein n=1 Tax=Dissostichus mawsoni TaxID=36200 RepID=A0A7J5XLJ7_DISMA|nr:hypothetical protein F7725_009638 [Dissostichus mawsoni]